MQIIDLTNTLKRHPTLRYSRRANGTSRITHLVIHHVAALTTPQVVASYHVDYLNWPGIGYHYFVDINGDIYQTNPLDVISYHAAQHNPYSVGIVLNGNFMTTVPSLAQQEAARWLVTHLRAQLPSVHTVAGHRELPGMSTGCPGDTYLSWLPYVVSAEPPAPLPEPGEPRPFVLTVVEPVRLRSAPNTNAPIHTLLPVGTELHGAGLEGAEIWVKVDAKDGLPPGWVAYRYKGKQYLNF